MDHHKFLVIRFDSLYKNYPVLRNCCIYCGIEYELTIDHVPSLDSVYSFGVQFFADRGVELWKVKSCSQCNTALSNSPLFTIEDRKDFIANFLVKKYKKVINTPIWDEADLDDLGQTLRNSIIQQQEQNSLIRRRIKWALE